MGEPSRTATHAQHLHWYQTARKPTDWIFILPLLKVLIGIYLQKAQFLLKKKKRQIELPISMNNLKIEIKKNLKPGASRTSQIIWPLILEVYDSNHWCREHPINRQSPW